MSRIWTILKALNNQADHSDQELGGKKGGEMLLHKRRYLVVDEQSVFHSLVYRAILRVYKNKVSNIEVRKVNNEREALTLMMQAFKPDIVIARQRLTHACFDNRFTVYCKTPHDQEDLVLKLERILAYQFTGPKGVIA